MASLYTRVISILIAWTLLVHCPNKNEERSSSLNDEWMIRYFVYTTLRRDMYTTELPSGEWLHTYGVIKTLHNTVVVILTKSKHNRFDLNIWIICTRLFNLRPPPLHTQHTRTASKIAVQHITHTWIHSPPFLPIPAGYAQWTTTELASALVMTA